MDPQSNRLYRFGQWLIRLRFLGILCILLITFGTRHILRISVHEVGLYVVAAVFFFLNLTHLFLFRKIKKRKKADLTRPLRILTNFQISTDFIIQTLLLHFSGGIDNPFIVYFIFHMIMASIVLSPRESYFQAGFAWSLVIVLAVLEYQGIIPHYPLDGFITPVLYESRNYLSGTGFVFITTSFLVVYITNSIVKESRRHEAAYIKANKELEKKDEIKSEYVQRITHDIKGHLAAIKSSLDVLLHKPEGSIKKDCREFLDLAAERTSILIRFVKDLLYMSRLQLSNEISTSQFSIRESIDKIVGHLEHPATEKSISIKVEIDDNIDLISGTQLSIEELISNLMGNAIQYSETGSEIYLRAKHNRGKSQIGIKDNGPGIPEQERRKIFEEFYRSRRAREIEKDGTGLGLSIVKKAVESLNGKITVYSEEGKGTAFHIYFPRPASQSNLKFGG